MSFGLLSSERAVLIERPFFFGKKKSPGLRTEALKEAMIAGVEFPAEEPYLDQRYQGKAGPQGLLCVIENIRGQ